MYMKNTEALQVPADITIEEDGEVYRWTGESGICIGRLDDFAQAAYIEGKPNLSKRVQSAQEGLDYILQHAR